MKAAAERVTLAALIGPSLARLHDLIEDAETPAAVAVSAIRLVLERTGYGEPMSEDVILAESDRWITRYLEEMPADEREAHEAAQEAAREAREREMRARGFGA